ncbi:MAG: glycosyltransferase [Pseudomonadota bacterium]
MTGTPRITVILPTFNRADYLAEAVGSVLRQTRADWELLVINDGGRDVGPLALASGDPRVFYHAFSENRGKAACCNFGLRAARGEYVAYLDDDDLWRPHHLDVLARTLDERPAAAGAYSDLYCVNYVEDETRKRRIPVTKAIKASRDFNREAMWGVNLALHVSFMHRKEAAFRVGGYDEKIKVFIDWDLTRKLCFVHDLIHVSQPTGEFFAPAFPERSQRISDLGRRNEDGFRRALRMIKADLPPEPWPKIKKICFMLPVARWDEALQPFLARVIDHLHHPFEMDLIDCRTGSSLEEARAALGEIGRLGNVHVLEFKGRSLGDAYLWGAKNVEADLVFAATTSFQPQAVPARFLGGVEILEKGGFRGVKWAVREEERGPFDLLMERRAFIDNFKKIVSGRFPRITRVPPFVPDCLKADAAREELIRLASAGDFVQGRRVLDYLMNGNGGLGLPALIPQILAVCYGLKDYHAAERACRDLIAMGYEPDNYLRLGQVLSLEGDLDGAVQALEKGLDLLGFTPEDLNSPVFPAEFHDGPDVFMALVLLGDCRRRQGRPTEARAIYENAVKIRSNSGLSRPD